TNPLGHSAPGRRLGRLAETVQTVTVVAFMVAAGASRVIGRYPSDYVRSITRPLPSTREMVAEAPQSPRTGASAPRNDTRRATTRERPSGSGDRPSEAARAS